MSNIVIAAASNFDISFTYRVQLRLVVRILPYQADRRTRLNKASLPVNSIGPIVNLSPGSISVAVERLFEKGLVSRVESPEDRRVRVEPLTPKGKEEHLAPGN